MKLIKRDYYLNKLLSVKDVPDIKVITGVRRSGKSKLMDAFIDLISADDKANIVRIKLNLKKFEKLLEMPELLRTPIVRNGKKATIGYCPEVWKTWE